MKLLLSWKDPPRQLLLQECCRSVLQKHLGLDEALSAISNALHQEYLEYFHEVSICRRVAVSALKGQQRAFMRYCVHHGFACLPPVLYTFYCSLTDRQCVCLDRNPRTGQVCYHVSHTHMSSVTVVRSVGGLRRDAGHLQSFVPAASSNVHWMPGMALLSPPLTSSSIMREVEQSAASAACAARTQWPQSACCSTERLQCWHSSHMHSR